MNPAAHPPLHKLFLPCGDPILKAALSALTMYFPPCVSLPPTRSPRLLLCAHTLVFVSLRPPAECRGANNFLSAVFLCPPTRRSASWIQGPCCVHHAGEEGVRADEQPDLQEVQGHEGQAGGGHLGKHRGPTGDGATQPRTAG